MIDIIPKIHDTFSLEFKVSYIPQNIKGNNDFSIHSWYFIPNSLDLHKGNYGQAQFYRDVKSNIRLVVPNFKLNQLTDKDCIPFIKLKKAIDYFIDAPSAKTFKKFEYQTKMFALICKSAIRDEFKLISQDSPKFVDDYQRDLKIVIRNFRRLYQEEEGAVTDAFAAYQDLMTAETQSRHKLSRNGKTQKKDRRNMYPSASLDGKTKGKRAADDQEHANQNPLHLTDEYLSRMISIYTFRVVAFVDRLSETDYLNEGGMLSRHSLRNALIEILDGEKLLAKKKGYLYVHQKDNHNNQRLVYRYSLLKKYVESTLYIKIDKKEDGFAISQVLFSLAAGLAMVFATVIAFTVKQKYGSVSMPLFVALVISYMLKDRMKELMKFYFSGRLHRFFFDYKAKIHISNDVVGWIRDGMMFVKDKQVPKKVMRMRNRTGLFRIENELFDEKIIAYKTKVFLDGKKLQHHSDYKRTGIHDIFRMHFNRFVQKMDDPELGLITLDDDQLIKQVQALKIYYIHIILLLEYNGEKEYRHLTVSLTRDGIQNVSVISE